MSKRAAQIFRDAALYYLWDGNDESRIYYYYSCYSIRAAAEHKGYSENYIDELKEKYWEYIGVSSDRCKCGDWFLEEGSTSVNTAQEHRFMCLLLMSEILKDD